MPNAMILFTRRENEGQSLVLRGSAPILPTAFDALSESLVVDHASIPCSIFSGQHFTGQELRLIRGGGCDDLATLPGNWLHKIRSVRFSHALTEHELSDLRASAAKSQVEGEFQDFKKQPVDGIELSNVGEEGDPAPLNAHDDFQSTLIARADSCTPQFVSNIVPKQSDTALVSWMERVFNSYRGQCACGQSAGNNCAHYLSDAMILQGATFPNSMAKCSAGRPLRAKELLNWFRGISTGFQQNHNSISSGYWFVYQETGGQGHVCIHREEATQYRWVGTGDFPSWQTQWHYFY